MFVDNERLKQKQGEIFHEIEGSIEGYTQNPEDIAEILMKNFCLIDPPEKEHKPIKVRSVSFKQDSSGAIKSAISLKPGNITLNWKKLLISGAESTFPTIACVSNPILIPLAAIIIWNKIWAGIHIDLDQQHAFILWTMWHNCNDSQIIKMDSIPNLVKTECENQNVPLMNDKELSAILNDLEKIKCIKRSDDGAHWYLIEKAEIPY